MAVLFLARALYDNEAETADELSFRRDDILAVLEIDTDEMEGWWLCRLREVVGIAPANRLKVISKSDSVEQRVVSPINGLQPNSGYHVGHQLQQISPTLRSQEALGTDYDIPISHSPEIVVKSTPDMCLKKDKPKTAAGKLSKFFKLDRNSTAVPASADKDLYDTPTPSKKQISKSPHGKSIPVDLDLYDTPTPSKNKKFINTQGGKSATVDQDLYDAPVSSKNTTITNQKVVSSNTNKKKKSGEKNSWETDQHLSVSKTSDYLNRRDSGLDDYDVPHCRPDSPAMSEPRTQSNADSISPLTQIAGDGRKKEPKSFKVFKKSEDLMSSFMAQERDVKVSLRQIIDCAPKWNDCKNVTMRASAVRLVCSSSWKKLQSLLTCIARIPIHGNHDMQLLTSKLKEQFDCMEKVTEFLTTAKSESLEKSDFDYVSELVHISCECQRHIDQIATILEDNRKELCKKVRRNSSVDIRDASYLRDGQRNRLAPASKLSAMPRCPSSSNFLDSSSDTFLNVKNARQEFNPSVSRSLECILGGEDYDIPSSNSAVTAVCQQKSMAMTVAPVQQAALLRHNVDVRLFDGDKEKRGAVVMDKGEKRFDILQRRNSHSKMAPSVMVAGTMGGDERGESGGGEFEEAVDYDYPMARNIRESMNHLSVRDRQLLKFYATYIMDELGCLKAAYSQLNDRVSDASNSATTTVSIGRSILLSVHKLIFMGDTILKNLTPCELKSRIQPHCDALSRLGDIKGAVKAAAVADSKILVASSPLISTENSKEALRFQARQRVIDVTKEVFGAALKFADIIMRPY